MATLCLLLLWALGKKINHKYPWGIIYGPIQLTSVTHHMRTEAKSLAKIKYVLVWKVIFGPLGHLWSKLPTGVSLSPLLTDYGILRTRGSISEYRIWEGDRAKTLSMKERKCQTLN